MNNNKVKSIFKIVLSSIIGLLSFFVIYLVSCLIWGTLLNLLTKIPIISTLINLLLIISKSTLDDHLYLVPCYCTYSLTIIVVKKICGDNCNYGRAIFIIGMPILIISTLFIYVNIKYNDPILSNIFTIITSLFLLYKGNKISKEFSVTNRNVISNI